MMSLEKVGTNVSLGACEFLNNSLNQQGILLSNLSFGVNFYSTEKVILLQSFAAPE